MYIVSGCPDVSITLGFGEDCGTGKTIALTIRSLDLSAQLIVYNNVA